MSHICPVCKKDIAYSQIRIVDYDDMEAGEMTNLTSTISAVIKWLIDYGKIERPVYVIKFTRDEHGRVKVKYKYPIDYVFAYSEEEALIYIEDSKGIEEAL